MILRLQQNVIIAENLYQELRVHYKEKERNNINNSKMLGAMQVQLDASSAEIEKLLSKIKEHDAQEKVGVSDIFAANVSRAECSRSCSRNEKKWRRMRL
jgi:nitrogen regulatory protein PII